MRRTGFRALLLGLWCVGTVIPLPDIERDVHTRSDDSGSGSQGPEKNGATCVTAMELSGNTSRSMQLPQIIAEVLTSGRPFAVSLWSRMTWTCMAPFLAPVLTLTDSRRGLRLRGA